MQLEYNYNLQLVCNLSTATKNQQLQRARFSSSGYSETFPLHAQLSPALP